MQKYNQRLRLRYIGHQGCGKPSFCRILLPYELRYYNDRINFKNETDLNLGLTSFALINIDEFDKTTARRQILLKYLLSTAVNFGDNPDLFRRDL